MSHILAISNGHYKFKVQGNMLSSVIQCPPKFTKKYTKEFRVNPSN